jgi:predicted  nucleic acid-binding Zn-ribbon protein
MYSRRDARASEDADLERYSMEGLSEIMSNLSRLLLQADDLNRGVETVAKEAQRTVESLQEHAQQAERELRAMENQIGDLLSEIDTIQGSADVLRRMIGEIERCANDERVATKEAVADCLKLLVQLKELLAHLQERRMLLGHLQEVAREWTEVTMRYRHLAKGSKRNGALG